MGPKDWSPWIRPTGNFMLSDGELERLRELRKRVLRGDPLGEKEREDILWACEKVKALARLKVEEFDFPRHLRLVNPIIMNAFKATLAGRFGMRFVAKFRSEDLRDGVHLFDHTVNTGVDESILIVRPWVKTSADCPAWLLDEFKGSSVDFVMDGESLIKHGDIEDHLVGSDGFGLRRKPFSFVHPRRGCLFFASLWDKEPLPPSDKERMAVLIEKQIGYFATNGTGLELRVWNKKMSPGWEVGITSGIVSALYRAEWV